MLSATPIYRSLYKPLLFVGCERLPFTFIVAIGGGIIMAYQTAYTIVAIFIFYTSCIILIRRVNNSDPQFFQCLYRYLVYFQDYYPVHGFYPGRVERPRSYFG